MTKNNTKNNKDRMDRQIPLKNYIIVTVIFILTIGLVIFIKNWYQNYQDYTKTIPMLKGVISEVRSNEIENYISDNPSAIVYIGVADDDDCRNLEKDLKKLIIKNHLKEKIVYYNITDVLDKTAIIKKFNDEYAVSDKINSYPAMVIIDEGLMIAFKDKTEGKELLISDIEQLFEEYEVYGD